jgi:hypothetical protein
LSCAALACEDIKPVSNRAEMIEMTFMRTP